MVLNLKCDLLSALVVASIFFFLSGFYKQKGIAENVYECMYKNNAPIGIVWTLQNDIIGNLHAPLCWACEKLHVYSHLGAA